MQRTRPDSEEPRAAQRLLSAIGTPPIGASRPRNPFCRIVLGLNLEQLEDHERRGVATCDECVMEGRSGPAAEFSPPLNVRTPTVRDFLKSSGGIALCPRHLRESGMGARQLSSGELVLRAITGEPVKSIAARVELQPNTLAKNEWIRHGQKARRAVRALLVLIAAEVGASVSDIARLTGVPPSTIRRIIRTDLTPENVTYIRAMVEDGYLEDFMGLTLRSSLAEWQFVYFEDEPSFVSNSQEGERFRKWNLAGLTPSTSGVPQPFVDCVSCRHRHYAEAPNGIAVWHFPASCLRCGAELGL